jgi:hypothetical protein
MALGAADCTAHSRAGSQTTTSCFYTQREFTSVPEENSYPV